MAAEWFRSHFQSALLSERGTRPRSWLRQYPTSRKVAGLIYDGVFEIFHCLNPSVRTVALGSTLTEMNTRRPVRRADKRVTLTFRFSEKSWKPQPPGALGGLSRPVEG